MWIRSARKSARYNSYPPTYTWHLVINTAREPIEARCSYLRELSKEHMQEEPPSGARVCQLCKDWQNASKIIRGNRTAWDENDAKD